MQDLRLFERLSIRISHNSARRFLGAWFGPRAGAIQTGRERSPPLPFMLEEHSTDN